MFDFLQIKETYVVLFFIFIIDCKDKNISYQLYESAYCEL